MTNRIVNDPNWLPPEPTPEQIRQILVDLWSLVSVFITRETADYSITGNVSHETVICANTGSITIDLTANPNNGDIVTIIRTDAQVTIDANGKKANNAATIVLGSVSDYRTLIFSSDDDEWWSY